MCVYGNILLRGNSHEFVREVTLLPLDGILYDQSSPITLTISIWANHHFDLTLIRIISWDEHGASI